MFGIAANNGFSSEEVISILAPLSYNSFKILILPLYAASLNADVFPNPFLLFTFIPEIIVSLLLDKKNKEAFEIALVFADYTKYAFLFLGLNIVFSSSFTAIQKPFHSIVVAALRGLILPVICIYFLPFILNETGLYMAISVAEFTTIILAYYLWKNTKVIRDINTNLVNYKQVCYYEEK